MWEMGEGLMAHWHQVLQVINCPILKAETTKKESLSQMSSISPPNFVPLCLDLP